MKNVEMKVDGNILTIKVGLTKEQLPELSITPTVTKIQDYNP